MKFFLFGLLGAYIVWTLAFAIKFNKTNTGFTKGQMLIHNILIWLIPFIWIIILKTITKPIPGSGNFNKTKDKGTFYESEIGEKLG